MICARVLKASKGEERALLDRVIWGHRGSISNATHIIEHLDARPPGCQAPNMSRDRLDGRLVTVCDGCGAHIEDERFHGIPGVTEFLGIRICSSCHEKGVKLADVLLASPL